MMKESKDDSNRWRDISCPWIVRINIIKMISILPKAIHRFNEIPIKFPMVVFSQNQNKKIEDFMEIQKKKKKTNIQSKLQKEQRWEESGSLTSDCTTKLQSSKHYGTVQYHEQKYGSVGNGRRSRDKPTHVWPTNLRQKRPEYGRERRQSLQ